MSDLYKLIDERLNLVDFKRLTINRDPDPWWDDPSFEITFIQLRSFRISVECYEQGTPEMMVRCEGSAKRLSAYLKSKFGLAYWYKNKGVFNRFDLEGTDEERAEWVVESLKEVDFILDLIYTKAK